MPQSHESEYPPGYEDEQTSAEINEPEYYPATPVHIMSMDKNVELTHAVAPEYGATMTWTIPQFGAASALPVQILNRRPRRSAASIIVPVFAGGITALIICSKVNDVNNIALSGSLAGSGLILVTGNIVIPWTSAQPAYAIGIGGGINLPVLDQSFGG